MAAYSIDLRKKIFSAWENQEGSQRELAKRFKVSLSFIRDMLRRYRETGKIEALPQGGDRRAKLKGEEEELLKEIVAQKNDIYLREIKELIQQKTGIEISISTYTKLITQANGCKLYFARLSNLRTCN